MWPRSSAPPRRAGGVPRQGRAGWVGTDPASPPRRASSGRCGRPALSPLLCGSCGVCASAPSGSPHRPQSHFPGLRTSFPWPPHLPDLLTGLRSSCPASSPPGPYPLLSQPPHLPSLPAFTSFLTFSPARPPPFLPPPGEGSDTLSCAVPRARGAGLGGGGASRAVFCPARSLRWSRVPQGQIRCL